MLEIALVASPVTTISPVQAGGAQAVVADLAQGLTSRGHRVTLHCARGSEVPGVRLAEVDMPEAAAQAARIRPGGRPAPRLPAVDRAIAAMFDAARRNGCDVVGQHAFDAAAYEAEAPAPVVHTLHLPPLVPEVVDAAGQVPPGRLVCVSESSRRDWQGAGVAAMHVIRNGISPGDWSPRAGTGKALAAGRLSPEKGFEDAILACREAGIRLEIAGDHYDPGYRLDLEGAGYLGALPRAELRRKMAEAAVFVCPVRWEEPFGLAAAEAQMAGCPVAGYRRGALPEVVEEGVSGLLVEGDDVGALARAIVACLSLDRAAVRASAVARLGIESMLDGYEAAYLEAAR